MAAIGGLTGKNNYTVSDLPPPSCLTLLFCFHALSTPTTIRDHCRTGVRLQDRYCATLVAGRKKAEVHLDLPGVRWSLDVPDQRRLPLQL